MCQSVREWVFLFAWLCIKASKMVNTPQEAEMFIAVRIQNVLSSKHYLEVACIVA